MSLLTGVLAAGVVLIVAHAVAPQPVRRVPAHDDEPGHTRSPGHARLRRIRGSRPPPAADMADMVDLLVLGLRAGLLPLLVLRQLADDCPASVQPAVRAVLDDIDRGTRLGDALRTLPRLVDPAHEPLATIVADQLVAAEVHGLPLTPVLERLAADARERRRRDLEAAVRRLPVRLSLPLVLCTLPSFVLVAVVPLLLAALTSLRR
jgi:tight adherence protein C